MIHHEWLIGKPVQQREGSRDLLGVDEEVIGETEVPQQSDSTYHVAACQKVIGFGLGDVPHPAKAFEAGEVLQPFSQLRSQKVHPSHNPQDEWMVLGESKQEVCLILGLVGLHRHGALDARRAEERLQLIRQEIAPEDRHVLGDPAVPDRIEMPEVLVGVDLHGAHGISGPLGVAPRSSKATAFCRDFPRPSIPNSTTSPGRR